MSQHRRHRIHTINSTTSAPLRVATGGMLVTLLLGGGLAVAQKKSVDIDDNGVMVHTVAMGGTVGDALAKAGVQPGPGELVTPPLDSALSPDTHVQIRAVRHVAVTIDGQRRDVTTTALTVDELVKQLDDVTPDDALSASKDQAVPVKGLDLVVTTPKEITLVDGTTSTHPTVKAATVADALTVLGVALGDHDTVTPDPATPLEDGLTVSVTRTTIVPVTTVSTFEADPVTIDDNTLPQGETKVLNEGTLGSRRTVVEVTTTNGVKVSENTIEDTVLVPPEPKRIARGTKPAAPSVAPGSRWDTLAACESTNRWDINTGNGFSGGLQFTPSTWLAFGGGKYAPVAWQATREQQIDIAEKVLAVQGWGAWPACTRKLGWR